MSDPNIRHIETADELRAAYPVMQELRPHLADESDFAARVARMRAENYACLLYTSDAADE